MNKKAILYKKIRIVGVGEDYLIGAKGYRFFRYNFDKKKWQYFGKISDGKYGLISRFRMLSRLLRVEVHYFKILNSGHLICVAKNGIFWFNEKTGIFVKCFNITRGTRPLNVCEDSEGNVYFGEYFHNPERENVHIYMSKNQGLSWEIAFTFPEKSIRHIHGIHFDKYTNSIWITTGDLEGECIIGNTMDKFETLDFVFRGGQEYRACNLLFYQDKILYGTDSETAGNQIKSINRELLKISDLTDIQGSVINSVKIGENAFFSTTVEPSQVNKDQNSYIWMVEENSKEPKIIAKFKKDLWDHRYFQFGNCRFPDYVNEDGKNLYFSGSALEKIDGNSMGMEISSICIDY